MRKAALAALLLPASPAPAWRWAIVNLLGRQKLYALVTDPTRQAFVVRALAVDGSFAHHVVGLGAIFSVDFLDEEEVRRNFVEEQATGSTHCETFQASPILASLCGDCGAEQVTHGERAAARQLGEDRDAARAKLRGALGIASVSNLTAGFFEGTAMVALVKRWEDGFDRHGGWRPLTWDEWELVRASGVSMGDYPEPSTDDDAPDSQELP